MKGSLPSLLLLAFIGLSALVGYNIHQLATRLPERSYSRFLDDVEARTVRSVTLKAGTVTGIDRNGGRFTTFSPDPPNLVALLRRHGVEITTEPPPPSSGLLHDMALVLLLLGGWLIFMKKGSATTSRAFIRGKSYRSAARAGSRVGFADVAGISEAQEELKEITDFLKDPEKYSSLGGRIPRGVLLQGPPGTGKTLLAKAIAGEASVPFYSIGGSDFVEMFAGLGASRVRELFGEAKKHAPCIIFIDEIDAIGGRRSSSYNSGSSDEREQTLNALLVEMDGFGSEQTIIVVAATNRADILDSALLRPGRFDRRITLNLPDIKGRLKILEVHTRRVALDTNIDLSLIAGNTPGFSGADLANLVNEAALLAARRSKHFIELIDFEDARDKIIMGLERKHAVISETTRRLTAYHEAGHAVIATLLPHADPLHKITIIPRGLAHGLTEQLPLDGRIAYSCDYLLSRIKILMGGRAAEALVFGHITTGASNDILAATRIAHRLVCEFGMSETIGPIACTDLLENPPAAGAPVNWQRSEQTLAEIDREILGHIASCCEDAKNILKDHSELLHMLAEALLANETLDAEEVHIIHTCYQKRRDSAEPANQQTTQKTEVHYDA